MYRDILKCLTLLIDAYIPVCSSEHLCCKVSSWQHPSVSRIGLCDLHIKYWRLLPTPVCRSHNISNKNRLHPAPRECDVWSDISWTTGDCCYWINSTTEHVKSNGVKSQHLPVCVISGFRHGAYETCALLESYAVPTFRSNLSVLSSKVIKFFLGLDLSCLSSCLCRIAVSCRP